MTRIARREDRYINGMENLSSDHLSVFVSKPHIMSVPEKEIIKSGDLSPSPQHSDIEIGTVEEPTRNGDEALNFLKNAHNVGELTPEDERRLVRKIDWMIMPLMWCCYCLQYLDKTLGT